jgi:hypothetical protein
MGFMGKLLLTKLLLTPQNAALVNLKLRSSAASLEYETFMAPL